MGDEVIVKIVWGMACGVDGEAVVLRDVIMKTVGYSVLRRC